MARLRLAADIGGTFTDLVLISEDGRFGERKVLSTPGEYWRAVVEGFADLLREQSVAPEEVVEICHATTVATNAVLERSGPKTGLITTQGFRDVLELRRMRFPETYNVFWEKPAPLVERYLRLEVDERIDARGNVLAPIDEAQALQVIERLVRQEGVVSIAVALLNAPVNPAHEQAIARLVAQHFPGVFVSLSSDVLPQLREYERTSTTVLNAYLRPLLSEYLQKMATELRTRGFRAPVFVMQSSGGIMSMEAAIRFPVHVLESGPAAGIVGAVSFLEETQASAAITFDMGGTTAKAAMIEGGVPLKAAEFEVGAPISIASRVLKGGGYLVRVPAIDVAEVGAGGGSIAAIDPGGALVVGPRSAGAAPGPACYDLGGDAPTVTDANLVLGFLDASGLLGGQMPLRDDLARKAIANLATGSTASVVDLAHGIRRVAVNTMARAVHSVSTERGRDVRKAVLVAFGGNGPVHAAALADILGMKRALVPRSAGVFSALGLLYGDNERSFVRPFRAAVAEVDPDLLGRTLTELAGEAADALGRERPEGTVSVSWFADMRYRGQTFELRVPLEGPGRQPPAAMREAFEKEYRETYGHDQPGAPVQFVNVGCVARARVARPALPAERPASDGMAITRQVYFSPEQGFVPTPVLRSRVSLGAEPRCGPLLVEEYDSTTVVPPHWQASLTPAGSILLERIG